MGAEDVDRAVRFWSAALGYTPHRFPDSENQFTILIPPGEGTRVALQRSDLKPERRPQVHIDLVVDDAQEQASECQRLLALGASPVDWDDYPEDADFVVLSDTEGNRFCIVDAGLA